ncbi:response regulator [Prolixibacteraceae bacterium Z1-6]|uniref:histidine kinase n=2 Tax=Draconibacterium aestuarii TaxID=2998507 RepID=A0A9X3J5Z5_9BACT|nr:response regulator [Prolixibacteraceae bacterium Z1-6]
MKDTGCFFNICLRFCLILLGFVVNCNLSKAGTIYYDIRQITNTNGLSNSSVNKIFQDSENLIWIGTWDGLNIYNGSDFTAFHPKLDNTNCISNQVILDITEDWQGKIWVNTNHGINSFDKKTNTFKNFYFSRKNIPPTSEYEFQIARDSYGNVFCAAKGWGIGYFKNDSTSRLYELTEQMNSVRKMQFLSPNYLFIQYVSGELLRFELDYADNRTIVLNEIEAIRTGVSDMMVFADSILIYLSDDGALKEYSVNGAEEDKLLFHNATKIIGSTKDGIVVHSDSGNHLIQFNTDKDLPYWFNLIKDKEVSTIYSGNEQITWIGTDGDGVYKIYPQSKVFWLCSNHEIADLDQGIVRAFCETQDGSVWVGTKGSGLLRFVEGESFSCGLECLHKTYNSENSGLDNSVFSLCCGNNGFMYIGTDEGLTLFDFKKDKLVYWKDISGTDTVKEFKSVYSIYQDDDNTVWLGTNGYGLISFKLRIINNKPVLSDYRNYLANPSDKKSISSNIIFSVLPENDSLLWLGTRLGGLNLFNKNTGKTITFSKDYTNPQSLSNNDILCLHKDKQNRLWIGTSLGINLLTKYDFNGDASFVHYTMDNGLANNTVHGIVSDSNNHLWISTNYGVSCFDPSTEQFQNYSQYDGLQDNEFADGAYYYSKQKDLIFLGGINGFNYFNPGNIAQYSYIPSLLISEIKEQYQNKSVSERVVIDQQSDNPPKVKLNYNQNFFNIKLTALSYINTGKCKYAYQLKNFDHDWNYIQNRRDISFTNVPAGNYELWVKWSNCDDKWSYPTHAVDFEVKPIFWRSNIAMALYLLFIMMLATLIYNYLKKRSQLKQEQLFWQKEEELHQTKLTFFTNIAHELQTPLTLIVGPIQKLVDSADMGRENQKFVKMIQRNTNRLLFLIQQLLEFRKAENQHLEIRTTRFNIVNLLEQISELFDEMAIDKKISYVFESPSELICWFDQDKLEKILFNLLSNAFKYTPSGGKIILKLHSFAEDKIEISVSNSGKEIPKEKLDRLFERFFIDDEDSRTEYDKFRTGIGLAYTKSLVVALGGTLNVKSNKNELTTFNVILPAKQHLERNSYTKKGYTEVIISKQLQNILLEPVKKTEEVSDKIRKIEAFENNKPTILIVEDEPEIHILLQELLNDKYRIIAAGNGIEALDILSKEMPDLIISDVMMPGMDGIELCKKVKNDLSYCHIPFIMLTAKSSVIHRIEGLESGANSYIPKPFHPKHLEVRIDKMLKERSLLLQHFSRDLETKDISNLPIDREDKQFIEKVIQLIKQKIDSCDLQAEYLENEMGMSSANFYRKLKQISGLSPGEMIRVVRLKYAADLLRNTSMNVTEIFYQSGFNNRSYFYREFQKMYQIPPKQYQLKYSKKLQT